MLYKTSKIPGFFLLTPYILRKSLLFVKQRKINISETSKIAVGKDVNQLEKNKRSTKLMMIKYKNKDSSSRGFNGSVHFPENWDIRSQFDI